MTGEPRAPKDAVSRAARRADHDGLLEVARRVGDLDPEPAP